MLADADQCCRVASILNRETTAAVALLACGGGNADRGGHIGGNTVPYSIGSNEGMGTGYVVLGTDDAGVGFNFREPRLELGSRVVVKGFG